MRPHPEAADPGGVADDDALPFHLATQHEVLVAAEIGDTGSTRTFETETLVTRAEPNVELLSAVHDHVEIDLIGSVQRDGAMCVTVTVQPQGGTSDRDEDEQSWTTVVAPGESADFALGAAEGLADGTEAHGTIQNRRLR